MGKMTEFNHWKQIKIITLDTFSSIQIYKCTHEKALQMIDERIYQSNHYVRLNQSSKMYMWGMIDMLFREIENHFTVYLYQWIDGKLYNSDELKQIKDFTWKWYTDAKKGQYKFDVHNNKLNPEDNEFWNYSYQNGLYSGKYWIEKDSRTNEYRPYYTSLD